MDIVIAVLFPVTWMSHNLIHEGLFEILAICLTAEFIMLFMLGVFGKKIYATTHKEVYRDWALVRLLMLGFLGYLYLDGVPWNILLFAAMVIVTAGFPLRIGIHRNWQAQLTTDIYILLAVMMFSSLIVSVVNFPPVASVRVPGEGIIHDLVVDYHLSPVQILAVGTLYYWPKALLNGRRYLELKGPGAEFPVGPK